MEDMSKNYIYDYVEILKKNMNFDKESKLKENTVEMSWDKLIPQESKLVEKIEQFEKKQIDNLKVQHKPQIKMTEMPGITVNGKR